MFSGLRLIDGVCLDAFVTRFGKNAWELYPQISGWVSEGLMEIQGDHLRLTSSRHPGRQLHIRAFRLMLSILVSQWRQV